jgi:hypothetical protein
MMRGISLISGVIFLAVTLVAVFIVYEAAVPVVNKMRDAIYIQNMRDAFVRLDEAIRQVASEGKNSRRSVSLHIDAGKVVINGTDDVIYWEYDTDTPVISPRTYQVFGNLVLGSNLNTRAYEQNYTLTSPEIECYVMENEHLRVYVRKIGSSSSHASYSTNQLLVGIYNKDLTAWLNNTGFIEISVDNETASKSGTGYTELSATSNYLPYATVSAFMNSSYLEYFINLTLESGADFIEIEGSY